jgi:hypothetical protein
MRRVIGKFNFDARVDALAAVRELRATGYTATLTDLQHYDAGFHVDARREVPGDFSDAQLGDQLDAIADMYGGLCWEWRCDCDDCRRADEDYEADYGAC